MIGLDQTKGWLHRMDTASVTDMKINRQDLQDLCELSWCAVTMASHNPHTHEHKEAKQDVVKLMKGAIHKSSTS